MTGNMRSDEEWAFAVVRQVLGVTVELFDTGGRQSAIDGVIKYPDSRLAALEISSLGPEDEARISYRLARGRNKRDVPGLSCSWYVTVPTSYPPQRLPEVDKALLRCEQLGAPSLRVASSHEGETALEDLVDEGVRAEASRLVKGKPVAYFYPQLPGGALRDGLENLPAELSEYLAGKQMQSKIEKLVASGHAERHLFLIVRPSAFSYPVYDGLMLGGPLPSTPPLLSEGIDQIWLATGWASGGVIRATDGQTWRRDHPFL